MTTIYIVKNEIGEYDEREERSICAVTTEEKAIALVKQLIEFNKFVCEFNKRMRDEFRDGWERLHQLPAAPEKPKVPEGYHELQRVLSEFSKKPVTSKFLELKEDFKNLQKQHDVNITLHKVELETYHEHLRVHMEERRLAETELFNKNYITPSHLSEIDKIVNDTDHFHRLDNKYSYYQLNLLQ